MKRTLTSSAHCSALRAGFAGCALQRKAGVVPWKSPVEWDSGTIFAHASCGNRWEFERESIRNTFQPGNSHAGDIGHWREKACQKSLAEFAARRRQRDSDHFLSGRVPDRKYNSGCKCAICTPKAYKSCTRQTAILLSKKGKALFRQSRILYVFLVFQTEEVGQKDGGDSQTQLCGAAL